MDFVIRIFIWAVGSYKVKNMSIEERKIFSKKLMFLFFSIVISVLSFLVHFHGGNQKFLDNFLIINFLSNEHIEGIDIFDFSNYSKMLNYLYFFNSCFFFYFCQKKGFFQNILVNIFIYVLFFNLNNFFNYYLLIKVCFFSKKEIKKEETISDERKYKSKFKKESLLFLKIFFFSMIFQNLLIFIFFDKIFYYLLPKELSQRTKKERIITYIFYFLFSITLVLSWVNFFLRERMENVYFLKNEVFSF